MRINQTYCGIDAGSTYIKTILTDGAGAVIAQDIRPTGSDADKAIDEAFSAVLTQSGADGFGYLVATGCHAQRVTVADAVLPQTDCCAAAVRKLKGKPVPALAVGEEEITVLSADGELAVYQNDSDRIGAMYADAAELMDLTQEELEKPAEQIWESLHIEPADSLGMMLHLHQEKREGRLNAAFSMLFHITMAKHCAARLGEQVQGDVLLLGGLGNNRGFVRALGLELRGKVELPSFDPQLATAIGAAERARLIDQTSFEKEPN